MLLSRLAVDRTWHGKRFGTTLSRDALRRGLAIGQRFGAQALYVHALSEQVRPFYIERGFRPVPAIADRLGLVVTFAEIRRAEAGHP